MGCSFSAWHAAACLRCLPRGSFLLRHEAPVAMWSYGDEMLFELLQIMSGGGYQRPWEVSEDEQFASMSIEDYEQWNRQEFKEVSGSWTMQ